MSFMNKVKNFFYEDIEEDDDEFERREAAKRTEKLRKKEEKEKRKIEIEKKSVEISKPKVQEKTNEELSERELFKSEKTFNFPMDIGDDIFDITETMPNATVKEETRKSIKEEKNIYARSPRNVSSTRKTYIEEKETKSEEPKKFKPTPVVSPIYGILDKNYTVDDVVDSKLSKTKEFSIEKRTVDFDTVRNRAYKELDEEIEKTLTGNKDIFYNLDEEEVKESNDGTIDDYIEEPYDKNENNDFSDDVIITYEGDNSYNETVIEKNNKLEEDIIEEENDEEYYEVPDVEIPTKKKRGRKKVVKEEKTEEKEDLFNLIDNMYNDEEDEEEDD